MGGLMYSSKAGTSECKYGIQTQLLQPQWRHIYTVHLEFVAFLIKDAVSLPGTMYVVRANQEPTAHYSIHILQHHLTKRVELIIGRYQLPSSFPHISGMSYLHTQDCGDGGWSRPVRQSHLDATGVDHISLQSGVSPRSFQPVIAGVECTLISLERLSQCWIPLFKNNRI